VRLENVRKVDGVDYAPIRPRWWIGDGEQWVERDAMPR
jgi:hypothetical protein